MRRSAFLPMTTFLAVLTAFALLGTALALRPPPVARGGAAAANRAVVQRFYDAVNAAIATGDATPLAAVLAPDYAERDGAGGPVSGRPALERSIQALRETAPGLRLEAETLIAEGDRVIALVRASGGDGASVLGFTLDAPYLWGAVDLFRIAGGLLAERTSAGAHPTLLERLVQAPVEFRPPGQRFLTALRVTLPSGAHRRTPAVDGLRLLYVEAGALAVEVASSDGRQAAIDPPTSLVTIVARERLIVPNGAAYGVRNLDSEPAVLLEMLATVSASRPGAAPPAGEGALTQILAGGQSATIATGSAILAVGRATLAPGTRVEWSGAAGPLLLAVEAGTLGLATEGAPAWVRKSDGGTAHAGGPADLGVGDGALLDTNTGAEIRNAGDGPLVVLVMTLLPEASPPLV